MIVKGIVSVLGEEDEGFEGGEGGEEGWEAREEVLYISSSLERTIRMIWLRPTFVIELLTACSARALSEPRHSGMVPNAPSTVSGVSVRCEIICNDDNGPLEYDNIRIVTLNTSSLNRNGWMRHNSTSFTGRPGTTAARMSGEADTRERFGRQSLET